MADVTLTSAVRDSLLSLQNTTSLIDRTQSRLSTGLKVGGPIDDPVAYFQAKGLSDRATDFSEKKDAIDQGVSTVNAALDGVEGIEALVKQMKGLVQSMKSATSAQIGDLVNQFNELRTQINNLATDSTYQGTNLVNGTGQTLTIEFSDKTASRLSMNSVDLTNGTAGLNLKSAVAFTGQLAVTYAAASFTDSASSVGYIGDGLTTTQSITVTWQGPTHTYTAGSTVSFTYGSASLTVNVNSQTVVTAGSTHTIAIQSAGDTTAGFYVNGTQTVNFAVQWTADNGADASGSSLLSAGDTLTLTWNGGTDRSRTFTTADGDIVFRLGTGNNVTVALKSGQSVTLSQGETFSITFATGAGSTTAATWNAWASGAGAGYTAGINLAFSSQTTATSLSVAAVEGVAVQGTATASSVTATTFSGRYAGAGTTDELNAFITEMDSALTTLRTQAQTLGSNVALLNTRLDFTENYVNTLEAGAGKLTIADINEEAANLLALQTRQQLGIQALSFAGAAEQSVLSLF